MRTGSNLKFLFLLGFLFRGPVLSPLGLGLSHPIIYPTAWCHCDYFTAPYEYLPFLSRRLRSKAKVTRGIANWIWWTLPLETVLVLLDGFSSFFLAGEETLGQTVCSESCGSGLWNLGVKGQRTWLTAVRDPTKHNKANRADGDWGTKRQLAWQMTGFSFPVAIYITHESVVLKLSFLINRGESVTPYGWRNKCLHCSLPFLSLRDQSPPPNLLFRPFLNYRCISHKAKKAAVSLLLRLVLYEVQPMGTRTITQHWQIFIRTHSLPAFVQLCKNPPPPPPPLLFNLWHRKGCWTELFGSSV